MSFPMATTEACIRFPSASKFWLWVPKLVHVGLLEKSFSQRSTVLPEGLTKLDKNAFRYCPGLMEVTLPSTLKTIGDHAFFLCENLREIVIPEGVTSIGERAFQGCRQMRRAVLPASIKKLSLYVFFECHSKLTIYAPKNSAAHEHAVKRGYGYVETK